jgi:FkbM family methyltransferase
MNYGIILKFCGIYDVRNVLDIGCHTGDFSFELRQNRREISQFVCVDLNESFRFDVINKGFEFHNVLLSSECKTKDVFYNPKNKKCTGTSVYRENTEYYKDAVVERQEATTLSEFCKNDFDLIKIDTQGSEYDIIMGGKDIVRKSKIVVVETQLSEYNIGTKLQPEITALMESLDFENKGAVGTGLVDGKLVSEDLLFINKKNDSDCM